RAKRGGRGPRPRLFSGGGHAVAAAARRLVVRRAQQELHEPRALARARARREADAAVRGKRRAEHEHPFALPAPLRARVAAPRLGESAAADERWRGGDEIPAALDREVDGLAALELRAFNRVQVSPSLELV